MQKVCKNQVNTNAISLGALRDCSDVEVVCCVKEAVYTKYIYRTVHSNSPWTVRRDTKKLTGYLKMGIQLTLRLSVKFSVLPPLIFFSNPAYFFALIFILLCKKSYTLS
jgi:hypothetical protein